MDPFITCTNCTLKWLIHAVYTVFTPKNTPSPSFFSRKVCVDQGVGFLPLLVPQVRIDGHRRGGVLVAKLRLSGQHRYAGLVQRGGVVVPELVAGQFQKAEES